MNLCSLIVHDPTLTSADEIKDTLKSISRNNKLILLSDFNAGVDTIQRTNVVTSAAAALGMKMRTES